MGDKNPENFADAMVERMRETLKTATFFGCASCQKQKGVSSAAGVHLYEAKSEDLKKAMMGPNGLPKVATYVICLECIDSLSEEVVYSNVTSYLRGCGLFGQ